MESVVDGFNALSRAPSPPSSGSSEVVEGVDPPLPPLAPPDEAEAIGWWGESVGEESESDFDAAEVATAPAAVGPVAALTAAAVFDFGCVFTTTIFFGGVSEERFSAMFPEDSSAPLPLLLLLFLILLLLLLLLLLLVVLSLLLNSTSQ